MSAHQHILRKLRLQLKTGFLRKEPSAYAFLKRYPPLSRDAANPVRKVDKRNIPYLKLYEKAVAKNPLYADEKVYQAYWAHEPQALTLAKKQYEHMEQGDTESEAYEKALIHVEKIEGEAYASLQTLMGDLGESLGGVDVKLPLVAGTGGKDLEVTMAMFREQLSHTAYSDLDLADQGEIDYFIQTKVLAWNEVERERRMKDPIFVRQFEKLRASLLPEVGIARDGAAEKRHAEYKDKLLRFFDINKARLSTSKPFYYEQYQRYFDKLRESPVLSKWSEPERTEFSHWIIDTLAVREMLDKNTTSTIQHYLDKLRAQFFPMIKYPEKALEYTLPALDGLKQTLYSNDIGYKKLEGQLFVKRFYLLPQLLFPVETFASAITADKAKLKSLVTGSGTFNLLDEMKSAGFDEQSIPQLEQQLQEYISRGGPGSGAVPGAVGGGKVDGADDSSRRASGTDMSTLDALLHDDDGLDVTDGAASSNSSSSAGHKGGDAGAAATEGGGDRDSNAAPVSEEWRDVISRYIRPPSTPLEMERQELLSGLEYLSPEELTTETELGAFKRNRVETELLARARLAVRYEQKESARRHREWQRRGMVLDSLPSPALELDEEQGR
jgi:hypothetical protein